MISFREKDYMYSYNKMLPKPFSTHLHRYYEFLYFLQGDATYIVEGVEYKAEDGDLFITRPGELHSIVFKSGRDYERAFIQISEDFFKDEDFDFLAYLREKPLGDNNKIPCHIVDKSDIKRSFDKVCEYVKVRRPESDSMIKSYIMQLVNEINALLPSVTDLGTGESERVRAAKSFINRNLKESITLDEIAEISFTDKFYLSHLFRRETGMTVKDYINMQRIALAKKFIEEGMGATEVYLNCGFNDYSSFYRAFKRLTGKSPSEFFKTKRG